MEEKQACDGVEIDKGNSFKTIEECAAACYDESSMFAFNPAQPSEGCWCQTEATFDGTCSKRPDPRRNLYKYSHRGKNFVI